MAFLRHFSSNLECAEWWESDHPQWHCYVYVVAPLENKSSQRKLESRHYHWPRGTAPTICHFREIGGLFWSVGPRSSRYTQTLSGSMVYPYQSAKPPGIELAAVLISLTSMYQNYGSWITAGKYSRRKKLQKRGRLGVRILLNHTTALCNS